MQREFDKDNVVPYREIAPGQSSHHDYDKALGALAKLIGIAKAA